MLFTSMTVSEPLLADGDLVVRRPDGAARHHVDDHERRAQKQQIHRNAREPWRFGASRIWRSQQRERRGEREPEPDRRRELQPRHDAERGDAREAAPEVGEVARERRERGHLAAHPLRERGKQGRDADEEQRKQSRALHEHDGL